MRPNACEGPLGALVGGYSDAEWLYDKVFRKPPAEALREAFALLGFRQRLEGDWPGDQKQKKKRRKFLCNRCITCMYVNQT